MLTLSHFPGTISEEESRIEYIRQLVEKMPRTQYDGLKQLVEFCCLLLQNSAINKFTPSALAEALGNHVLRSRELAYYAPDDSPYTRIVMEIMIKYFNRLFTRVSNNFIITHQPPVQESTPQNTRPQTPF